MATKVLRPISGSTLEHSLSSGSSPSSLLSESTQDGDATYIYHNITGTSETTKTTTINLGALFSGVNYNVTALRVYCVARITASGGSSSLTLTNNVNGQNYGSGSPISLGTSYVSGQLSDANAVNAINQALRGGAVPTVKVAIQTKGKKSRSKDDDFQIRITQLYVEVQYEELVVQSTGIFIKNNGAWKQYRKAFKKINGVWVEQQSLSGLFDPSAKYIKMN